MHYADNTGDKSSRRLTQGRDGGYNKCMTILLDLPPEMEGALMQEARRRGMTLEGLALDELRRLVPVPMPEKQADAEEVRQKALRETMMKTLASFEGEDIRETLSPADESSGKAHRNNPVAEIVAEKFQRQGFNV